MGVPTQILFAIFRQVGGIGAFTEVPNTRFAFSAIGSPQSGRATIPLTAGDVIVVRNVGTGAVLVSTGSLPNTLSATLNISKAN